MASASSSTATSSASASSSGVRSARKAEIVGWLNEWAELMSTNRSDGVQAIRNVFTDEAYQEHVQLMDRQQLVVIMVDLLGGKFLGGVSTNPARVQAILDVLGEIQESGGGADDDGVQADSEEEQESEPDADKDGEEDGESPIGTPKRAPVPTPKAKGRPKSPRKAKSEARRRIHEEANGTTSLLQQFANNVGSMGQAPKKVRGGSGAGGKTKPKENKKGVVSHASSVVDGDPDSSDSDSSSSESDSNPSSSSSSSESDSSSDSDNASRSSRRKSRSKRAKRRNSVRHQKRREDYKLAKQVWEMCGGRVHYYLSRHEWGSKRSEYEVDTITRVFDHRMKHGASLWDRDIRLLACRIMVLQSHDLTGSWETAAQFQSNPMGYVVISKKQLSRAAKNAEQLQKIAPKQKVISKALDQSNGAGARAIANDQGYRPRADDQRPRWRNDRAGPQQGPHPHNNHNNNNNRAAGGAGGPHQQ